MAGASQVKSPEKAEIPTEKVAENPAPKAVASATPTVAASAAPPAGQPQQAPKLVPVPPLPPETSSTPAEPAAAEKTDEEIFREFATPEPDPGPEAEAWLADSGRLKEVEEEIDSMNPKSELTEAPLEADSPMDDAGEDGGGLLSMSIRGNMRVKLGFDTGQYLMIHFDDGGLSIRMSEGFELKVPSKRSALKKAA